MYISKFRNFISKNSLQNNSFYLGIFLLLSAPALSSFLLFFSILINSSKSKDSYFKDYSNIPFFFASLFMIISCIVNTFNRNSLYSDIYDIKLTWLGLFNWIPYFWLYWASKEFTQTSIQRKKILIFLLFGTIPLFLTGFLQYFFKIHGPFSFFFGLIKWYSRPIENYDGLSGLFNNANYAGTWLNIILPISLIFAFEKKRSKLSKYFSITILFSVILCILLTYSRNSWLGLIFGLILIGGINTLRWLLPTLVTILIPVLGSFGIFFSQSIMDICRSIIPKMIWEYRFSSIGFENLSQYGRAEMWFAALEFIRERPIWGWGGAAFPVLFEIKSDLWKGHTHNLPLELAVSYGLFATLLVFGGIIWIMVISKRNIIQLDANLVNYENAWWSSCFLIILSQMFDVQYFDIRIGLVFWILLSGLNNIKS